MKGAIRFMAAAVLLLVLAVSLQCWRVSYRTHYGGAIQGTSSLRPSGTGAIYYSITNSRGWLTVSRSDLDTLMIVRIFSFPWWAPALVSAVLLALIIVRMVRRKQVRGFSVDDNGGRLEG